MPSWVKQQLADAAGVVAEVPERAKLEFQRLGIGFVLHPVYDEGPAFLRAVGSGEFEHLVRNAHFPTSAASSRREIGSRKFVVGVGNLRRRFSSGPLADGESHAGSYVR